MVNTSNIKVIIIRVLIMIIYTIGIFSILKYTFFAMRYVVKACIMMDDNE